jgi:predicted regulator of Ras-like GTPase activity (Roadblock/LC7/MglB family)
MAKLSDVLKELRNDIGGDIIQLTLCGPDGIGVAQETIIPDKDMAEMMTGRATMGLMASKKATDKLGLGKYEDTIVTTEKAFILTKFIGDGSYFIALSVTRKATLGAIRMLLEDYSQKLWDAIPR